jgi:hypothetical protein
MSERRDNLLCVHESLNNRPPQCTGLILKFEICKEVLSCLKNLTGRQLHQAAGLCKCRPLLSLQTWETHLFTPTPSASPPPHVFLLSLSTPYSPSTFVFPLTFSLPCPLFSSTSPLPPTLLHPLTFPFTLSISSPQIFIFTTPFLFTNNFCPFRSLSLTLFCFYYSHTPRNMVVPDFFLKYNYIQFTPQSGTVILVLHNNGGYVTCYNIPLAKPPRVTLYK